MVSLRSLPDKYRMLSKYSALCPCLTHFKMLYKAVWLKLHHRHQTFT